MLIEIRLVYKPIMCLPKVQEPTDSSPLLRVRRREFRNESGIRRQIDTYRIQMHFHSGQA